MLVEFLARCRTGAARCFVALALLSASFAHAQTNAPAPRAAAPAKAASPSGLNDGQAEERLLAVYQLMAQGRSREALTQAESLARDYPNFQLAQLAVGDMLLARSSAYQRQDEVPTALAKLPPDGASDTLNQLLFESRRRVDAQSSRPVLPKIPAQFIELSPRSRHAVAVDASRSRLYLFENDKNGLRLVGDYYASVGKQGIEKYKEGDQRTPLGVYYFTSRLDPASLLDFYGIGAMPLNYPNPLDLRRGKTGSGIWLHGTPPEQFARAPLASDGCVVLSNPDLERILRTVEPRTTPIVIAQQISWVTPQGVQAQSQAFDAILQAWSEAKSQGNMQRLMDFYAPDFQGQRSASKAQWAARLRNETNTLGGRKIHFKDKSYLRWTDSSDTMVVTFAELIEGARSGPTKRQYWTRNGDQWQIFYEGVIG